MVNEDDRYREATGREPVERYPKDHPDRWQWDYAGRPAERDELLERLGLEEKPEVADDQESLF